MQKNIVHAKWKIESLTWIILRVPSPWDHFSNFQRISLTLCLLVGLLHDSDDNSVEYHLCYSFMKGPSPPLLWWTIPEVASTLIVNMHNASLKFGKTVKFVISAFFTGKCQSAKRFLTKITLIFCVLKGNIVKSR